MRGGNEVEIFALRSGRSEVPACPRSDPLDGYRHTVAGGVDPGETPEEAALRELQEETGLTGVLARARATSTRSARNHRIGVRALDRRSPPSTSSASSWTRLTTGSRNSTEEHDEYRWCTPDERLALLYWEDTSKALQELLARP
jgi:8-oxo-dGTP pyrophosphatase MutT (NUDIX family)